MSLVVLAALALTNYSAISSFTSSANGSCRAPSISEDGTRIAFYSDSNNLYGGASNPEILVYDTGTGNFTDCSSGLVTLSRPSISRDGRYVVFYGGDGFNSVQPYAFDMNNPGNPPVTTSIASTVLALTPDDCPPTVSDDVSGTYYMAFQDLDTNLFSPNQIRRWAIGGGSPVRVSNTGAGAAANANCSMPVINAGGDKIAFVSAATNLDSNSGGVQQVFLATLSGTWTTSETISKDASGNKFTAPCSFPTMSANANIVAFECKTATKHIDVWVRDRSGNTTAIPYDTSAGYFGANEQTWQPNVSSDGVVITYQSFRLLDGISTADSLDTYPLGGGTTTIGYVGACIFAQRIDTASSDSLETHRAGTRKLRGGEYPVLSEDGSSLAFSSGMDRMIANEFPTVSWIFLRTGASW
jgi:hypothetical protein